MQETQEGSVQSLGQEDPLEEEIAIHSSIIAWEIPWTEEPVDCSPWGHRVRQEDTNEQLSSRGPLQI